jgi:type VI secretion system Hcp family effector
MPHQFLMTLSFKQQGKVKGSVPSRPHTGTSRIPILTVYTGRVLPWLGSSSGSTHGGKTIVITKQVDSASPLFWSSLATQEVIASVKFVIHGPGDGKNFGPPIGQVGLTNVVVRNIHTVGHHVKSPPKGSGTMHQITLGYQTASLDLGSSSAEWTREWTSSDA